MRHEKHLFLELARLKSDGPWSQKCEGISFLFFQGGTCNYETRNRCLTPVSGDVLTLTREARGRLVVPKGNAVVFWRFSVQLEHLYPLFAGEEIALLKDITENLTDPRLIPASNPLAIHCHHLIQNVPSQYNLDHRSQLLRVATLILAEEFKRGKTQRAGYVRMEDHLIEIFESLSADEILNMSVDEMASRFSCSRRHLSRLFHQYFGFSVAALRMEMRLLKAISLLRDPDMKVIEVADRCGFNHLGLFNSCFKRRFGTSPGQWRKASRTLAENNRAEIEVDSSCPLRSKGLCPWTGKPEIFGPQNCLQVMRNSSTAVSPLHSFAHPGQGETGVTMAIRPPDAAMAPRATPMDIRT